MNLRKTIGFGTLIGALIASSVALAQQGAPSSPTDHEAHSKATQQPDQSMMGDCPMMKKMMDQEQDGMMGKGMGPGMMQGGMAPGALFGSRVTPMMNLSVDDVRSYLDMQLDRLKNKRLKVGDVKADDGTITADIVTIDNSLVQRLKVNRHTGAIEYQD